MTLGRIIKRELFSHEDITGDPAEQDLYLLRTLRRWKSSPIELGKIFLHTILRSITLERGKKMNNEC